ncbi:MAG: hypothetical protein FJX72_20350 [Armatimonadetes bacterium]|nr:hypothetical protein [Armatimonadota bacterium]
MIGSASLRSQGSIDQSGRWQFSRDFEVQVRREIEAGTTPAQAAREHQDDPGTIVGWRKRREQYGEQAFAGNGHAYTAEARIGELERLPGQLTMENALPEGAVSRLETLGPRAVVNGGVR